MLQLYLPDSIKILIHSSKFLAIIRNDQENLLFSPLGFFLLLLLRTIIQNLANETYGRGGGGGEFFGIIIITSLVLSIYKRGGSGEMRVFRLKLSDFFERPTISFCEPYSDPVDKIVIYITQIGSTTKHCFRKILCVLQRFKKYISYA